MDISNFDIEEYNKRFAEETKDYTKICAGKPCQYVDECRKNGKILFCQRDDEEKELQYVKGRPDFGDCFSFKNMCRRDDFPEGGYDRKLLEVFYWFGKISFPKIMPPSIDVLIEELKEMGLYKEESEEQA